MQSISSLAASAAAWAWAPPASPPSSLYKNRNTTPGHALRRGSLSCRAGSSGGDLHLDRRDVLAGLMGVTAGGLGASTGNLADAVVPACKGNEVTDRLLHCDPFGKAPCPRPAPPPTVVDFTLPGGPMRVRRPAHLADSELVAKYRLAVARMKALPESDPRSFMSQARIHEAYCDAHYKLSTTPTSCGDEEPFDVHFSWIFAPWHRMYIYFYERILGHLIGDDTFALPYWNWDAPAGMVLPAMFRGNPFRDGWPESNSLYDCNRNMCHVDKYVVLDYFHDSGKTPIPFDPKNPRAMNEIVKDNLSLLYHQMIRGGKGARCFHGEKFCTDDEPGLRKGTSGTLDRMAHSGVHIFLGDKGKCYRPLDDHDKGCGMDMGFLGTAARDPVFYTHHANVDRMWHLWAHDLPGHRDFEDPKWLDTSFVFYDEKPQPVRIRVRDVLDVGSLGYRFEEREPLLWKDCRPTLSHQKAKPSAGRKQPPPPPPVVFPLALKRGHSVVALDVIRPRKEKGKPLSLVFDNSIKFDRCQVCKFDVAINVPLDQAGDVGPRWVEYAGTFSTLARSSFFHGGGGGASVEPIYRFQTTSLELPSTSCSCRAPRASPSWKTPQSCPRCAMKNT